MHSVYTAISNFCVCTIKNFFPQRESPIWLAFLRTDQLGQYQVPSTWQVLVHKVSQCYKVTGITTARAGGGLKYALLCTPTPSYYLTNFKTIFS